MTTRSQSNRYVPAARFLHGVLALGLFGLFFMGSYMADLPFSPQRLKLYNWHKWAGITVLILSVLRLAVRWTNPPPALPSHVAQAMPPWQLRAYLATHSMMYVLFFLVPLVGWAYSSAAGFPIVVFGVLPLPDFMPVDKELAALIKPWHANLAWALAVLVVVHIGAALKHHWIDKDGLLQRMLPGRS